MTASGGEAEAPDQGAAGRLARRLGLALLLLLLALLALEAVARWTPLGRKIYYQPPVHVGERENRESPNFVPDPLTGWRMRPEAEFTWTTEGRDIRYLADEEGFRTGGPGQTRERTAEERLIVLVGDSHTWGWGLHWEETAGARLEAALEGTRVVTRAMPGFGVDQMWMSLRHWALPLEPDLVVVCFGGFNLERCFTAYRVAEGFNKPRFGVREGELVRLTAADRPGSLMRYLENHSRLHALGWQTQRVIGKQHGVGPWWELSEALLDAIRADADAAGVPLLFLYLPLHGGGEVAALEDYMARHEQHLRWVESEGPERLYFERDGHLDPAGHRAYNEVVLRWLEETALWAR